MRTLAIRNGDLAIEGGNYAMVDGRSKLFQDLAFAIGEPFGNDRFHPRAGSLLDRYIGGTFDDETSLLIRSEVIRVITQYADAQREVMRRTAADGLRQLFTSAEIVRSIESVSIEQQMDRIKVKVSIRTGSGETVALNAVVRP
jgi:hypothetical protein